MTDETKEFPPELSTPEFNHRLWISFGKQAELLEKARMQIYREKSVVVGTDAVWSFVIPFLHSIVDSCSSLYILAQAQRAQGCFIIGRTLFEQVVNICYVLAKGSDVATRARLHLLQKSYRDLERQVTVGSQTVNLKWEGKEGLQITPEMEAAVKEFTTKKGTEIRDWTPESILQRIEAIDAHFGNNIGTRLQLVYMAIYRNASEISHGTLFGTYFLAGLTQPRQMRIPDDLPNQRREWISMLLLLLGGCIEIILSVLGNYTDTKSFVEVSRKEIHAVRKELRGEQNG